MFNDLPTSWNDAVSYDSIPQLQLVSSPSSGHAAAFGGIRRAEHARRQEGRGGAAEPPQGRPPLSGYAPSKLWPGAGRDPVRVNAHPGKESTEAECSDCRQTYAAKHRHAWGDCEGGMVVPPSRSIHAKMGTFRKFPFWRFKLSTLCRQLDFLGRAKR